MYLIGLHKILSHELRQCMKEVYRVTSPLKSQPCKESGNTCLLHFLPFLFRIVVVLDQNIALVLKNIIKLYMYCIMRTYRIVTL